MQPSPSAAFRSGAVPATPHLKLPATGQALRRAMERRDPAVLARLTAQLRVLGCRVQPEVLLEQLLTHGCVRVQDAFGQDVLLDVAVPQVQPRQQPDEALVFRITF